jgi:hypothetical protein
VSTKPADSAERRRVPRVDIDDQLTGSLVTVRPVVVRDIGLGGMAIQSSFPLEMDREHLFELKAADGTTARVRARVVRSLRGTGAGQDAVFITGLAFCDDHMQIADSDVGRIIDQAMCVLTIDQA